MSVADDDGHQRADFISRQMSCCSEWEFLVVLNDECEIFQRSPSFVSPAPGRKCNSQCVSADLLTFGEIKKTERSAELLECVSFWTITLTSPAL
ncbi:hypothetical protein ABZR56_05085 [Pseudomonas aeruginosa]